MAGDNGQQVLTLKEVATLMRISDTKLYRLLNRKPKDAPPHRKIGGEYRFPKKRLLHWIGIEE